MGTYNDLDKPQATSGTYRSLELTDTPKEANPAKELTGFQKITHGIADKEHPNMWNVVYGLKGAYDQALMNNIMVQPIRKVMQATGYGRGELQKRYPNQTKEWYDKKLDEAYSLAINLAREDADERVKENPYFGDKVANFIPGVLGSADPTWFIPVPGVAGLAKVPGVKGVAARVATNAAGHAAFSAAADAAAQGMDIATDTKKDFDIERNLTAAAFGAGFGGGAQGLGEAAPAVSKFVKNLFGTRGMDTLPPGDPRVRTTSPLTGEQPTMSPEQTTQLRELLETGSVDEIKGFFVGKQGPQPTWQDINHLVETRDASARGSHERLTQALDQHLEDVHASVLRDHFDEQTKDWRNKPEVEVLHTAEDIADPAIRQSSIDEGLSHENTVGFVGPDGKVRVFAGAVKTPDQANAVLFHEGLGHYGLQQHFGAGLDKTLDTLVTRNVGQFGKAVDAWQKKNPGAYNGNRTRAAEEVLAEMSQNGQVKKSVADAMVAYIRRFGRQMGMKLSYSDAEVKNILAMAHDAVVNGKGRDATGNGFRRMGTEHESNSAWLSEDNPFDTSRPSARRKTAQDFEMSRADVEATLRDPDEIDNPFEPMSKDLSDRDVGQIVNEDNVYGQNPREPSPGDLSRQDVRQIASEDTGPRFMTPEQLAEHGSNIHESAYRKLEDNYTPRYRSIAEAKAKAENTALDPSVIKKSRSVGNLDRKLFVYDNAATQANERLMELAKKAEAGPLSADDMVDLVQTTNDFNYVLGRLNDDLGEVGRALNAAKQITFRRNNIMAMKEALEAADSPLSPLIDPETANKFLKQFAQMLQAGNPNGAARMINSINKPYWWQYLLSWRSNMMLSGLSTHLKVSMDTATNAGREVEEKLAALPMGAVRSVARGLGMKGIQQGVHPTEVALHLWGMARAVLDAQTYKNMSDAFKGTNNQRFGGSGIQNPRIPVVSKITDAISAQDAFYRSVLTNAHLYALGGRAARKAGLTRWDDITTAAAGHAQNPTRGMLDEATDLAENVMLTNRSEVNDALDRAKRIKPGMNGIEQLGSFIINYLTPFVRTQSNSLMNQLVRRSPLSFLDPKTKADWAAGGARRDVAVMRTVIGTAIIVNAWNAAGSDNPEKRLEGPGPVGNINKLKELEASGWRPNSVHENGRYSQNSNLNLSLNPFDLHNNTATLVAGVRQAWDQGVGRQDAGLGLKLAFASAMNALQSQVFVNDIGLAWEAFSKPGEVGANKMERFVGNQATSFVPNALRQTARIVDPVARDTSDGIPEQIKATIPGMSDDLPARVTPYGDDVKTGASPTGIRTWFNQGPGQDEVTDPAQVELARLGGLFKQTIVSPVERTISVPDTSMFKPDQITDAGNVKLTAKQFEEYQRLAGKEIVENTRDMMASPEWDEMSDEDKAVAVRKMASKSKKAVREYLYGPND